MKREETYYDLLKVDRRATVADIVTAYHTAKNAFSKDSVAAYSLFSPDEADTFLKKLEEAYLTLSNKDRKVEYDRTLDGGTDIGPREAPVAVPISATIVPFPAVQSTTETSTAPAEVVAVAETINGAYLRTAREQKGMSIEDVCRLTKITTRTVQAIENDDKKKVPARVYLQGFVTNLAKLYRLDPIATTKGYLQNIDKLP